MIFNCIFKAHIPSQGNQPWILIGRTDAESETPVLWPPDVNSWLTGKDADAGKDWGQKEKGATENEMVGWHHQLNGHEFERTLGDGEGQGSWCVAVHGVTKSQTKWASEQQPKHTFLCIVPLGPHGEEASCQDLYILTLCVVVDSITATSASLFVALLGCCIQSSVYRVCCCCC